MEKVDFLKILCNSKPEEINEFISSKGKKKMVNGVIFMSSDEKDDTLIKEMEK